MPTNITPDWSSICNIVRPDNRIYTSNDTLCSSPERKDSNPNVPRPPTKCADEKWEYDEDA